MVGSVLWHLIAMFGRTKKSEPVAPITRLVLKSTVHVADVLRYPNGGPLVVLPRGMAIEDIEQQYIDQLCDKHFIRTTTPATSTAD